MLAPASATRIAVRPPIRHRLRTSRPTKSSPSGWPEDGDANAVPKISSGAWGERAGPKIAMKIGIATMTTPTQAAGVRAGTRRCRRDVRQQVGEDVDDDEDHRDRLDRGGVAILDGLHEGVADALEREEELDDDDAGGHRGRGERERLDRRCQRVRQDVPADDS